MKRISKHSMVKGAQQSLGVLFIMAMIISFTSVASAYQTPAEFLYQARPMIATARYAVILMFAIAIIISIWQGFVYELVKLRWVKLDERQLLVRQRVFEISHKVTAFFLLFIVWQATHGYNLLHTWSQPGYSNAYVYPLYAIVIFVFAFPALLAAYIDES